SRSLRRRSPWLSRLAHNSGGAVAASVSGLAKRGGTDHEKRWSVPRGTSAQFGVQHFADFGEQGVRSEWLVQEGNRRLPGLRPARLVAIPGHVEDLQPRSAFRQCAPQLDRKSTRLNSS